jgi:hypothetical protein
MKLLKLKVQEVYSIEEFINYWKRLYIYANETVYSQNINLEQFEAENVIALFQWKNGMTIEGSGTKEKSLTEKILSKLHEINHFKSSHTFDLESFMAEFNDISAVWRIFLLHIIKPNIYPIYDQHVHRAYNFIHELPWEDISTSLSNEKKLEFYFNTYLPFFRNCGATNLKTFDEALFAFGQFLNNGKQWVMFGKEK